MRKNLILITLVLFTFSSIGQEKKQINLSNRVDSIDLILNKIDKRNVTKKEIENLNTKIENQQKLYNQTISGVSTQLDSASYSLTIFGLLFTIIAILIGVYVTYVERKIVRISDENKEALIKNQEIKKEVEELNRLIQEDIYNLFLKIKKEETEYILQRLTKIPKDIANVLESLLSRDLSHDNYSTVKKAYFKLNDTDKQYKQDYHHLFFQHFFSQSLRDEEIRKDILDFIPEGIRNSFENDVINTASDLVTVANEKGLNHFSKEINNYFKGLSSSGHKNFSKVYETILSNFRQKYKAFELFNLVESNEKNRIAKIEYGNLLERKYGSDNNTTTENECFKELNKLIKEQETFLKNLKAKNDERSKLQTQEKGSKD